MFGVLSISEEMRIRIKSIGILFAIFVLSPQYLLAHLVTTGAGPFYDGTAHFFLTFEEILPVVALSLFAGLRGPRCGRWNVLILPVAWMIGGIAGLSFPMKESPAFLSTFLLLLPGVLLASDRNLPAVGTWSVSALLALMMGFANGAAMEAAGGGWLAVLGAAAAAFVVAVFGAALAVAFSAGWTRIAIRVAGSWLAALGLLTLGWSLRR